MKQLLTSTATVFAMFAGPSAVAQTPPAITGSPTIVSPDLLEWPGDFPEETPSLTEPTANRLADFHGEFSDCDIVLSTAGNYHMALKEMWQLYLGSYVDHLDIRNWFYTTSPPISPAQVLSGVVQFGNLNARCVPQVAVGPAAVMNQLSAAGVNDGAPVPIIRNKGNVILVKKGNPKHIRTVWDLGRRDVTLVTPHPTLEPGSFGNFSGSIYGIAANDPSPPPGVTAEDLFDIIFNGQTPYNRHYQWTDGGRQGCGHGHDDRGRDGRPQWVTGKRIMHREQPWAIYSGNADAGVIFYHLALYFVRTFPDQFEIVPLGGTVDDPQPLPGNRVGVMQAVRIAGDWTPRQLEAREALMDAFMSDDFSDILAYHGLERP